MGTTLQLFKNRGLALKIEATPGVDPVPTGADDYLQLLDGKSSTEFDKVERNIDRSTLTNAPFVVTNKRLVIEGAFELTAPTAPGASGGTGLCNAHAAFVSAGFAATLDNTNKTTRMNPISTGFLRVWGYFWHAGTWRKLRSGSGKISGASITIGESAKANYRLQGAYQNIGEQAAPTFVDTAFPVPTVARDYNTRMLISVVGGSPTNYAMTAKSHSFDDGIEVKTKEYTQLRVDGIADRKGTFNLKFARPDKADIDFWALRDGGTLITANTRLCQGNGMYVEIATRGQMDPINEVDTDGDYNLEITGNAIASSSGGDDYEVRFGQVLTAITPGAGTVATPYTYSIGGGSVKGPISGSQAWSVINGDLPDGLAINATTGAITGTPTVAGTFVYTYRLADATGLLALFESSITVS